MAILLAFGAGVVAGGTLLKGLETRFEPIHGIVGGTALVLLLVANVLATRRISDAEEDSKSLPGEKYADREAPEPADVADPELEGVPFSESKKVTNARNGGSERVKKLNAKLKKVNKELQRANVKLGLGELSEEGYAKIVERLKKRRAKIEDKLNRRD